MRSLALAVVVAVAGCATAYQPQSFSGGFSETQLDTNVFRVTFKGNAYTSAERVEEMVLLRSAELAVSNGFTHFAVVDGRSRTDVGVFTTPTQSTTTGTVMAQGNMAVGRATTTTTGGQPIVFAKPSSTNTIVCFTGKPEINGMVYDARFLMQSLGTKYGVATTAASSVRASPAMSRPIALRWEGYSNLITGTVSLIDNGRRGGITATLPNNDGRCDGRFEYSTPSAGQWTVTCTNNMAATGTFEAYGAGKGSSGRGKDTKGNTVEFTIGAGS